MNLIGLICGVATARHATAQQHRLRVFSLMSLTFTNYSWAHWLQSPPVVSAPSMT
jgi:hypothetical protein